MASFLSASASSSSTPPPHPSHHAVPVCSLRIFLYRSYLPHLHLQEASGRFFGFSHNKDRNASCLEGPCYYKTFGMHNILQYTGEVPIYQRLISTCPTTDDPNAADLFLVPFFFGYMMTLGWQLKTIHSATGWATWKAEHQEMMKAALAAKGLLPHLNNQTAARHVFLFSCDGQFVNTDLHPLVRKSLVVHLGDDAFHGGPGLINYVKLRHTQLMKNAVVVPYRVSQWLPHGFSPPVVGPRRLLLSMNVNLKRHRSRQRVADQLLADATRLNVSRERLLVSSTMMEPAEAAKVAKSSTFCVCPTGDSKGFTARFYFVLLHGCLPVRVDGWGRNTTLAPVTYPFPELIRWDKIVIHVQLDEHEIRQLLPRILSIPTAEIEARQNHLRRAAHWLLYDVGEQSHHDAPAALIQTLHSRFRPSSKFIAEVRGAQS